MPARNPIPLEGVLNCWNDPYDLPDLLLAVSRSGKTGRLTFSNAEGDKSIHVKDGKIVFADSSSDDDGLGQYLLRNGQISLDDFTRVSKLVSPGKRLGALLVAEGVLEPKDLVPAVVGQVRAIILGLFRRTETWYGFKEEKLSARESITLDMPVAQLILDGVQSVDSWRRISKGVGDLDSVYQVAGATEVEWSRLKLESEPTELLTLLNEPMRLADVCAQASIDAFDACRYLWAFRALEWIAPAEISVAAAAELAERAEMADSPRLAPEAPVTVPAVPQADLATTVMNLEAAAPIPQRLLETKISAVREPGVPRAPSAPRPAAPRPTPADLVHTRLAVEPPEPPPPNPATTRPEVGATATPAGTEPHHTQLYLDAPAEPSAPRATTTGEMMEAILDGRADAPGAVPETGSDSATRFFPAASALGPPPPPEEDFFHGSPDFASLSLDYAASPPTEQMAQSSAAAPEEEMPLIEATVVEDVQPVPPALVTTQPSISKSPDGPGGMELFVMNDPFQAPAVQAEPPTPFTTDDPLQYAETSVAASLPTRPRTEELDLDLGHFFNEEPE